MRFVTPDTALAATRNGLIYVSTDSAHSWTLVPFPLQLAGTLHALDTDHDAWYVGMEGNQPWTSGIYKSTDSGRTWKHLLKGKAVWSLAISSGKLAAGTDDGVYLSSDAGEAFTRISPEENRELRPIVSLAFDPHDTQVLYAGTTHLPWKTSDGGAHWQSIHSGMHDDSDVFSIVVDPKNPEIVLSSACSGAYRSTASGTLWTRMPTPRGAFRTYFVALSPANTIFAGTTLGLFRSLDSGKTWLKVTDPVRGIAFEGSKILMASLHAGILLSTDDGATVHPVNQGFSDLNLEAITASGKNLYAISASDGLFRSADLGATWTHATIPANARHLAATSTTLYAASRDALFASKDSGHTWLREVFPAKSITALSVENGTLVVETTTGFFRKATVWTKTPAHTEWDASAVSGATILAATPQGLLRSTDRGATWNVVRNGLDPATVSTVIFHPNRPQEAYTTQYGRILQSTDGGEHWTPLDDKGRDGFYPKALLISPLHPDTLIALFPRRGIATQQLLEPRPAGAVKPQ